MNRDEIARKVIELAAEQGGVNPEQVSHATHFVNDLNYDSLDRVQFAMQVEDEFGISISDEDAEKVQTVDDAIQKVILALNSTKTTA